MSLNLAETIVLLNTNAAAYAQWTAATTQKAKTRFRLDWNVSVAAVKALNENAAATGALDDTAIEQAAAGQFLDKYRIIRS